MSAFHGVTLELVRPGPPHNQLLSPLTPYMALCGQGSPVTFYIDIEHHALLSRLERLRYVSRDGGRFGAVPDRIREAAVRELGDDVAGILGKVRSLLGDVARARGEKPKGMEFVHLRLVLGGSELSLIPFEMAFAPQSFPGEGVELSLQLDMPVIPTREVRRSRPVDLPWCGTTEPRILFVSAAPAGLKVPLAGHLRALRAAVEPWVRWPKDVRSDDPALEEKRLPFVKERLRVLTNASIESIYDLCSREAFTHVHILAHGDHVEVAGQDRFGLALSAADNPAEKNVVTGNRLAKALQAEGRDGASRSRPVVVTLATCDSGNEGSVMVPGGSIAHELHTEGIPWVFASQFPLTIPGSVRMAETLYPRLLRGDDPRQALYEVRRALYMNAERDHDWASVVAYATIPSDFDDQVASFYDRQIKRAIEVALDHADDFGAGQEVERFHAEVRACLERWRSRLPAGDSQKERSRRAECYGMHGSTFKRIALLHAHAAGAEPPSPGEIEQSRTALAESLEWYRRAIAEWAMHEGKDHWVATQALALAAVLTQPRDAGTYHLAAKLAARDLANPSRSVQAWAHGTLAELEMLRTYHLNADSSPDMTRDRVIEHCRAIVTLTGENSFHVSSTCRQFQRYVDNWPDWRDIAQAAVEALTPKGPADVSAFPKY